MSGLDIPKFVVMPGEDSEKIEAANVRMQEKIASEARAALQRQADSELGARSEQALENKITPEVLMKGISEDLAKYENELTKIEGGETEVGRLTRIERQELLARVKGELPPRIQYYESAGARLGIQDKYYISGLNKLRAYSDYVRDVRI